MKRILTMVGLGIGGLVVATSMTLGALALAGNDLGDVVHPRLDQATEQPTPTPSADDHGSSTASPSVDDHGGGSGSGSGGGDSSGHGSGSGGSGSGSSGSGSGHSGDDD